MVCTTPWVLYLQEKPGTHHTAGLVGLGARLVGAENLAPIKIRSPEHPVCSWSLNWLLLYPNHWSMMMQLKCNGIYHEIISPYFFLCHVMLRIIRQVQIIPLFMPPSIGSNKLTCKPAQVFLVLQPLECETSPSCVVSDIEQVAIACEKYFFCIYRGYFAKYAWGEKCCCKFFILSCYEVTCLREVTWTAGRTFPWLRTLFVHRVSLRSEDNHRASSTSKKHFVFLCYRLTGIFDVLLRSVPA